MEGICDNNIRLDVYIHTCVSNFQKKMNVIYSRKKIGKLGSHTLTFFELPAFSTIMYRELI